MAEKGDALKDRVVKRDARDKVRGYGDQASGHGGAQKDGIKLQLPSETEIYSSKRGVGQKGRGRGGSKGKHRKSLRPTRLVWKNLRERLRGKKAND